MKLVIKEYLSCLNEREELDAILPDLLSEMGLTVFSTPSRGTKQDGVDVAAVGYLNDTIEKVYLFSIKAGDLTRSSWDGGTVQSLRPSLNEIRDAYIKNRLPSEHKNKPIVICLCLGGYIKEEVRDSIEGYKSSNKDDNISFEEWDGDKLSELILENFLKEELLPKNYRSMLRKSLALLDEPEISYKHFSNLVDYLVSIKSHTKNGKIRIIRQLNICLCILFVWCREANNLESAYLSSEYTLLHAWELTKPFLGKKTKYAEAIHITMCSIHNVYQQICFKYLNDKILPYTGKLHTLSHAVKPSCSVDINLKLFDILSRLAMYGIWTYWTQQMEEKRKSDLIQKLNIQIKQLIINNPILFSPYKDDQAIDITIAVLFLSLDRSNHNDIHGWLSCLISRVRFAFRNHNKYPCNLSSYHQLIEHPIENSEDYRRETTQGSILYPIIATFAILLGFDDIYNEIRSFQNESLQHCNFQLWYPDETSEEYFYTNTAPHGAILSNLSTQKSQNDFLTEIFKECKESPYLKEMSAFKRKMWPLILVGCRHYRLPIPIHFLEEIFGDNTKK